MARVPPRLLIPADRLGEAEAASGLIVSLEPSESHYLRHVLRCRAGDRVDLIDGMGHRWTTTLSKQELLVLAQPLSQPCQSVKRNQPCLVLALAVPRKDADVIWRMATELGVDQLQPILASRSVVRGNWPMKRWQTIVQEATEQCESLWLPRLLPPQGVFELWSTGELFGLKFLATTRHKGLPHLSDVLADLEQDGNAPLPKLNLAIGPEGGWTEAEEAAACQAGWRPISLSSRILRCSTAAVSGLSLLTAWRQISCASSPLP